MKQKILTFWREIEWQNAIRNTLYLTMGVIIATLNFHFFIRPTNVAPGGVTGMAIIINSLTGWQVGQVLLVLQIPMLIIGYFYLGRWKFLSRTVFAAVGYSVLVDVAPLILPDVTLTNDVLLNTLYGGIVGGIGTGLVFRGRGSMGGTSIVGRIIQLKTGMPVSQVYLLTDGVTIMALGVTFGWENALYALIMLFVWGLATDYVLEGPSVVRTAFIITNHPRLVADGLFNRTGLGVTSWQGEGMFTGEKRTVLFCTVRRPDVEGLREAVLDFDPSAFVVIGQGHQATGGVLQDIKRNAGIPATIPPAPQPTEG